MTNFEKVLIADKTGDISSKLTSIAIVGAFASNILNAPKLAIISSGIAILSIITEKIADEIWMANDPRILDEDEDLFDDFDDDMDDDINIYEDDLE